MSEIAYEGNLFPMVGRWLMRTDNMSFLEELCWAMAAVWRHLLKDGPLVLSGTDILQGKG